jgi:hypothetical protein
VADGPSHLMPDVEGCARPAQGLRRAIGSKTARAGELRPIRVPDTTHEAMQGLVRARATAARALTKARQQLQAFLLRHQWVHGGRRRKPLSHRRWLADLRFDHPAQQIVRCPNWVRHCLTGHLAAVSAAKGGAAKTAGKRTSTTMTAGIRPRNEPASRERLHARWRARRVPP